MWSSRTEWQCLLYIIGAVVVLHSRGKAKYILARRENISVFVTGHTLAETLYMKNSHPFHNCVQGQCQSQLQSQLRFNIKQFFHPDCWEQLAVCAFGSHVLHIACVNTCTSNTKGWTMLNYCISYITVISCNLLTWLFFNRLMSWKQRKLKMEK